MRARECTRSPKAGRRRCSWAAIAGWAMPSRGSPGSALPERLPLSLPAHPRHPLSTVGSATGPFRRRDSVGTPLSPACVSSARPAHLVEQLATCRCFVRASSPRVDAASLLTMRRTSRTWTRTRGLALPHKPTSLCRYTCVLRFGLSLSFASRSHGAPSPRPGLPP